MNLLKNMKHLTNNFCLTLIFEFYLNYSFSITIIHDQFIINDSKTI